MRRGIEQRLNQLAHRLLAGCPICRDWPLVWLLNEGDPEPPACCPRCRRKWTGLVRVYLVGVDVADI